MRTITARPWRCMSVLALCAALGHAEPPIETKLTASDALESHFFGFTAAIDGDTVVVGAPRDDDTALDAGAVYVFTHSEGAWTEQAKLTADDGTSGDRFGEALAISGNTIVVGAVRDDHAGALSGSAYVFTRVGTTWTQQQKLTASGAAANENFGISVAVEANTVVVGADRKGAAGGDSGAAYVFVRTGTVWTESQVLTGTDTGANDLFGHGVAISGNTILVGAFGDDDEGFNAGSAYVFVRAGTTWTQQAKLVASDPEPADVFGIGIAIDGNTAVIGASRDDDDGDFSGSAYVFVRSGTTWTQQAKLTASDAQAEDRFGQSVAISGLRIVVGAHKADRVANSSGAAYVFARPGTAWIEERRLIASDSGQGDQFGLAVAIQGNSVVVGAPADDDVVAGEAAGSAYVFGLANGDDG